MKEDYDHVENKAELLNACTKAFVPDDHWLDFARFRNALEKELGRPTTDDETGFVFYNFTGGEYI